MIVGGYCLQLSCDRENEDHDLLEFPHEYTGETRSDCRKLARDEGWILHRNGEVTCPKCSGKEPKEREDDIETVNVIEFCSGSEGTGEIENEQTQI